MIAEKRINNKIKNIVAKAAKSPNRDYLHVIYNYPNRWAVVKELAPGARVERPE